MNNESQEQIKEQLEQLEESLNNLKDLLSSSINQSEQERIIKKNRIISRLEIENEKLKTKLSETLKRD
tara:strand:- start:460 stop:663 length:204 start_codon:yes stop_codon:yes gene_type:complete